MIIFTPNTVIKSTEINSNFDEITSAWTTWTPTWTNLTVGNGTGVYRYKQIGKMVWWFLKFTAGSTSSASSNPRFTLPVTPHSSFADDDIYVGHGLLLDALTQNYDIRCMWNASTDVEINTLGVGGSYSNSGSFTGPFTFGTNDRITLMGFYEAA